MSAETLVLTILAFYALRLRHELRKMRRVHSATMSILGPPEEPPETGALLASSSFELQDADAAGDAYLSRASSSAAAPLVFVAAGTACPLDAEHMPRKMCPLMHAERCKAASAGR